MVTIKKQLVSSRMRTFSGINGRNFITIHETANYAKGAGAQMHADLQSSGFSASWHWQVDDKVAIQSFPHTVRCWHAGDGAGNGNFHSIAIEICVNVDGDFQQAVVNAAALVKKIMHDEGIPSANVVQHHHWSGKDCPRHLRKGDKGIDWASFKRLLPTKADRSSSNLSYGSQGEAVKQLQIDLNKLGYKLTIDSSFGPATERAVKAFQASLKLTVEGIVGPQTQKALKEALVKQSVSRKVLKVGDKGDNVRAMQAALASVGFYPDKGSENYGVDGYFGTKTRDTVKRFQSVYTPTEIDGIFGPKTRYELNRIIKK
ncbi:peptidoglycan recognition protein family protein [Sporosarcina ureilytica]|uniref:N-acetylmuramoyl-L-alanine amidase n=1 Tax=Sporosarcina ureilytica TaxID=298596 RepID=A0A1D8JFS9_9BACL|nr:N-acetylmuramoyl-L-alanine amidase [Sporosarcina ureilytica]AOV07570.1 hypothetical protein BI350_08505 [Sporosarcina ureilytica]